MRLFRAQQKITAGLPVISGSSVSCQSVFQDQTVVHQRRHRVWYRGDVGRWAVGRPTSGNASRPTHRHRVWSSFPVHRIGSLFHCRHPSAGQRTPRSLVRNMERDVRDRTPVSVAGCRFSSATGASDERPLRQHSDRVSAHCLCNVGLLGIKPGGEFAFSSKS